MIIHKRIRTMARFLPVLTLTALMQACASHIPEIIKSPPAPDLSLPRVQHDPERHLGQYVRWGGSIISVENNKAITELTILAKPLDSDGEPADGDKSYGRFIARHKGFLDPAIYASGRSITVYGKLGKLITKKIDNFEYRYPLVEVEHLYLWEVKQDYDYYNYPYWYDPWYPYWGPYYHHPYRHY